MKNLKYLIFFPCIFLFSCYDHNDVGIVLKEFKGQIIANDTKSQAKNLKLKLKYLDKKYVDSTVTDKNGEFSFAILNYSPEDYTIEVNPKYGTLKSSREGYFLDPIAYLKLTTTNENASNSNDLIYFSNLNISMKGFSNKPVLIPLSYSAPKYLDVLEYEVTRNGKKTFFKKDIQLRGLDTLEVEIKY